MKILCLGSAQVPLDRAQRPRRKEILLQRGDPGERLGEASGAN